MNTFELSLDLDKSVGAKQWVTLRQGDKRGTTLQATLYDHGVLVSGSYTCRVSIRHPNRNTYYRETATYSNGVATVTVDETSAASVVGVTEGYFELLQGSTLIASTESFGVRVLQSATDGATVGPPYDSAIEDALAELDAATGRISQMVVDATAEYLAAHPEITTTVQDNSVTDAKLIQSGGVLDRVGRLWWRLENLLTNTPAESESVTVADAAQTPVAGLTVYGKSTQDGTPAPDSPVPIQSVTGNLFDPQALASRSSYTVNADGTVTVKANDNTVWTSVPEIPLAAGTYVLAWDTLRSGQVRYRTSDDNYGTEVTIDARYGFRTFTLAADGGIKVKLCVNGGQSFPYTEYPQITRGATVQPFVPYNHVGLWARGRNLLPKGANGSSSSVTYTVQDDGSVVASGTASGTSFWGAAATLPAGEYSFSGCPSGGGGTTFMCDVRNAVGGAGISGMTADFGNGGRFALDKTTTVYLNIRISGGYTANGLVFHPQIEQGTTTHAYEPYADSVTALPTDGHTLRSLPDGTRDEVTVDQYGHVILTQRVGYVADISTLSVNGFNGSGSTPYMTFNIAIDSNIGVNSLVVNTMADAHQGRPFNGYQSPCVYVTGNGGSLLVGDSRFIGLSQADALALLSGESAQWALATPVTHDLGTIDPTALVGPDMTAQAVPTAPFALTYERDLNTTLARLEAALATLA